MFKVNNFELDQVPYADIVEDCSAIIVGKKA